MAMIEAFDVGAFFNSFMSLAVAFILGTAIGAERQYRQRSAGLRTNVLVAVGAAAFVDLAYLVADADGAARVISYVVSGIGFLGAGVIMKDGGDVRGLNTAATLWASAAVGCCAGADRVAEAFLVAVFIIAGNTLLRPLVKAIHRAPIDLEDAEANHEIYVITDAQHVSEVREQLILELNRARYPVADIKTEQLYGGVVEIIAFLVSTSVAPSELDKALGAIRLLDGVHRARREVSTVD
ncbi:MgtC/SapB family protein [Roseibium algae]|uniref:Protein MgtC n=1 Tax=Roseibium algae TaxID=3123038 RepID=A0ABU8TJ94_9HYPH